MKKVTLIIPEPTEADLALQRTLEEVKEKIYNDILLLAAAAGCDFFEVHYRFNRDGTVDLRAPDRTGIVLDTVKDFEGGYIDG